MRAAVLSSPQDVSRHPLRITEVEKPRTRPGHVLLKVRACGVCRTDLHIVEGELAPQRDENLCDSPTYTGYTVDGGYAEYALARTDFVFTLPTALDDLQAAPLLCAGIIGPAQL